MRPPRRVSRGKATALVTAGLALGGPRTAAALQVASQRPVPGASDMSLFEQVGSEQLLLRGWLDHVQNMPAHLLRDVAPDAGANNYRFEVRWFEQNVDHINKQHSGKWWHRYFVYTNFSDSELNFPTFVFCGAEQGDIYLEWQRFGFMLEVAREHGAKVVYLEHRFFGQSMPFGDQAFHVRSDRVGLLSLEQSMADYEAIIRKERGEGPVLTYGGSLSGTLAVMMRIEYPSLVDMAFASSAPVLGVVGIADQFAWRKRLTDNFAELGGADCPELVRRAFSAFARRDTAKLHEAFQPCEQEHEVSRAQWDWIVGMAWQELERLGVFSYPPSKSGIPLACEEMRSKDVTSDEQLFAKMLHLGPGGRLPTRCMNLTRPSPTQSFGQARAADWMRGWSYMACTEVVHPIGANGVTDMFPAYNWTVEGLTAGCRHAWGVTPDAEYLRRKVDVRLAQGGAYPRARHTDGVPGRILFSYGTRDPWSTMVPVEGWADDIEIVSIEGGAHCSDLETARAEDTPAMREGRRQIADVIGRWIAEVRPLRHMKIQRFGSGSSSPLKGGASPAAGADPQ